MSFDNLWRDFKYKVNAFIRLNVGERQKKNVDEQKYAPKSFYICKFICIFAV